MMCLILIILHKCNINITLAFFIKLLLLISLKHNQNKQLAIFYQSFLIIIY